MPRAENAERYLARLNLKPARSTSCRRLPIDQLLKASNEGSGPPINFGPVVDGKIVAVGPLRSGGPGAVRERPVADRDGRDGSDVLPGQPLEPMDDATFHGRVKQLLRTASDADVDRVIAAYRKGRPDRANTDLYLIMASDATFRANILLEAERKARADPGGRIPVLLHLAITGTRRQAAHVSHAGNTLRVRQCRCLQIHDRLGRGPVSPGAKDEQRVGGLRAHRKSESSDLAGLGAVRQHAACRR